MRHKFLGTGDPGYHPLRKLRTIVSGLRYAVIYDFSVAWKLIFSLQVLLAALFARDWVDSLLIIVATSLVLVAEIMNSAIEALCDFVETRHNEKRLASSRTSRQPVLASRWSPGCWCSGSRWKKCCVA